jgi:hypothetical protein
VDRNMDKEQGVMMSFKCLFQSQGTIAAPPLPPCSHGVVPYRQHQGSSGGSVMVAHLLCNHQAAEAQRNCSCSGNMAVATKEVADGAQASKPVYIAVACQWQWHRLSVGRSWRSHGQQDNKNGGIGVWVMMSIRSYQAAHCSVKK